MPRFCGASPVVTGSGQTVDAATLTLASFSAGSVLGLDLNGTTFMVETTVRGLSTANAAVTAQFIATFKRIAAVNTQIGLGATQIYFQAESSLATVVIAINTSAGNIRCRVTGVAGLTINWVGDLSISSTDF